MTYPTFIEIDGKRVLWREIVQRRREQPMAAAKAVAGRLARAEGRINRWHASVATRSAISSRRRSPFWTRKVER